MFLQNWALVFTKVAKKVVQMTKIGLDKCIGGGYNVINKGRGKMVQM